MIPISTLTKLWTAEDFRRAIACLDAKTGLHGADLAIRLTQRRSSLGLYFPSKYLQFSLYFFNDPTFPESAAIDVIRHEYAHLYDDVAQLRRWIPTPASRRHHGPDWKFACEMVGARSERLYDTQASFPQLTRDQADAMLRAEDVRGLDILAHLRMWDRLPFSEQTERDLDRRLRQNLPPQQYFRPGDPFLHPQNGFGRVAAVYPDYAGLQHLWLRYDSGKEERQTNRTVVKIQTKP